MKIYEAYEICPRATVEAWRDFQLTDDENQEEKQSADVVYEIDLSQITITIISAIKNDKSENALNNNFDALI